MIYLRAREPAARDARGRRLGLVRRRSRCVALSFDHPLVLAVLLAVVLAAAAGARRRPAASRSRSPSRRRSRS